MASALAACQAGLEVPAAAQIQCAGGGCPTGMLCRESIGRCVKVGVDDVSPSIVGTPSWSHASAGAGRVVEVVFEVDEPLFAHPVVELDAATRFGFTIQGQDAQIYTYRYEVTGTETEGSWPVVVHLVDPFGNETVDAALGTLEIDLRFPLIEDYRIVDPGPLATMGTGTVEFTVDEATGAPPRVTVDGQAFTEVMAMPAFRFSYTSGGSETEGPDPIAVQITVEDEAGNVTGPLAFPGFRFDRTAPSVTGTVVRLIPDRNNHLTVVSSATAGTTVEVELLLSEPVVGDLTVTTTSPEVLAFAPLGAQTYEHLVAGPVTDGVYTLNVTGTDDAGNPINEDVTALFELDGTAPPPPDVDDPILIVFRRVPWGSPTETNLFTVRGAAGAVGGSATTVIAWDTAGAELGRVPVAGDGSFPQTRLNTLDIEELQVMAVDAAGNPSAPASVRNIEWVASMGGKVAGDLFTNPHTFTTQERFAPSLFSDGEREQSASAGIASISMPGSPMIAHTFGSPAWIPAGEPDGMFTRHSHAMAYDAIRGRVILFGGARGGPECMSFGSTVCADTRERIGTRWFLMPVTDPEQDGNPVPRQGHAMAFDAARGVTVLFGGHGLGETWEYDGTSWLLACDGGGRCLGPPSVEDHAMAYDARRQLIVLFGGRDAGGTPSDATWEWDGSSWQAGCTGGCTPPEARFGHAMTYLVPNQTVVMFGGDSQSGDCDGSMLDTCGGTWLYDGDWTRICAGGCPSEPFPRRFAAMAQDDRGAITDVAGFTQSAAKAVLFGGQDDGGARNDETWELECVPSMVPCVWTWTQTATTGPRPPSSRMHAMAGGDSVVLFGGRAPTAMKETWTYDRGAWMKLGPTDDPDPAGAEVTPSDRNQHAAGYHARRGVVVMLGGSSANNTTWEWNGYSWIERCDGAPGSDTCTNLSFRRLGHAMTGYDIGMQHGVVLFGGANIGGQDCDNNTGSNVCGGTHIFDGTSWTMPCDSTTCGPPPRLHHRMAFDADRGGNGVVVMFGGNDLVGFHDDLWEWDGSTWTERCNPSCSPQPSARELHAMTYDAARQVTLVFGGAAGADPNDELWAWNGTAWSQLCGAGTACPAMGESGPTGLKGAALSYDPERQAALLVGGEARGGAIVPQNWMWTGTRWLDLDVGGPAPRTESTLTYHGDTGLHVLFAGRTTPPLADTWLFDTGVISRPAHVQHVSLRAGGVQSVGDITFLQVTWHAAGRGYYFGGLELPGAILSFWNSSQWVPLVSPVGVGILNTVPPENLPLTDPMTVLVQGTMDQNQIPTAIFGPDLIFSTAVTPWGINEAGTTFAEIATDYVETEMHFRRP